MQGHHLKLQKISQTKLIGKSNIWLGLLRFVLSSRCTENKAKEVRIYINKTQSDTLNLFQQKTDCSS